MLLISIHAPLTGSDGRPVGKVIAPYVFQSTLPSQGSDTGKRSVKYLFQISIHAPLTGSDEYARPFWTQFTFQSTLPSQGATVSPAIAMIVAAFQSTLPSQGATAWDHWRCAARHISIHAPLTGSDCPFVALQAHKDDFNPRSPHRERRKAHMERICKLDISIHAPLTGSDGCRLYVCLCRAIFQSTLPSQGATCIGHDSAFRVIHFNPRSPHRERPDGFSKWRGADVISIHAPLTGSDRL